MTTRHAADGKLWGYLAGVVVVGLALTALLVFLAISKEIDAQKETFVEQSTLFRDAISRHARASEEGLYSLQTLFNLQMSVDAEQFRTFSSDLLMRHTFIKSILYLPLVAAGERAEFEQRQRTAGYAGYAINERRDKHSESAGDRARYFPVLYLEPADPDTADLLGFDALSDKRFAPAIEQAIDSGKSVASITSQFRNDSSTGYIVFKAIYAGMAQPASVEARRHTANGLLALVVDVDKLIADIPISSDMEIELGLQSMGAMADTLLAVRKGDDFSNPFKWVLTTFSGRSRFSVSGYDMVVKARGKVHWVDISTWLIFSVGLAGLVFTGLLMFITRNVIVRSKEINERNAIVEAMVAERTRELAIANDALRQTATALDQERKEQQSLIAKLQSTQGQLVQSEKMASIGQLAAGVAHEINNPVGYIYSNIGSLHRNTKDLLRVLDVYESAEFLIRQDKQLHEKLAKINKEVDVEFIKEDMESLIQETLEGLVRVKDIVQNLKDFSHVDESEWQMANIHKGLDSTLKIVHNEIKYKADVVKEYGDLPEVECMASQLNQVFMNLLVNAAHAIEGRGTITIRTVSQGDWVVVEIADTGKGIAPEHLSRIFEPFFTTKPIGKGTGLGLSVSYSIVERHGGKIEVDSELGKGTRFRVYLPVKQKRPTMPIQ